MRYRIHLICDGHDFYSKSQILPTAGVKDISEIVSGVYDSLEEINKFKMVLESGDTLLLCGEKFKNSIIIVENLED